MQSSNFRMGRIVAVALLIFSVIVTSSVSASGKWQPIRACGKFKFASSNDSWSRLAVRFGLSERKLYQINRASPESFLKVGDRVCVGRKTTTATATATTTTTLTTPKSISIPVEPVLTVSELTACQPVSVSWRGASPDTGWYSVQWVPVNANGSYDFNSYTMFNVRGTSATLPRWFTSGTTYAIRVITMQENWDGVWHNNENVTPHSQAVTFKNQLCAQATASASASATAEVTQPTFSVTYDGNTNDSGSVPTDSTAYTNGASVTVASNTGTLAKAGYTFNGWCTTQPSAGSACGGTSRAAASTFAIAANVTLYAVWTANTLTVTTDEQGGIAIANASTTTGASMSSPGTPTRASYTFAGWFTASSGGSAISFPYTHGQTANFTLYAQWTASCAAGGPCAVGDEGPGGGQVFYAHSDEDNLFTSIGSDCNTSCKYLEVSPRDSQVWDGLFWSSDNIDSGTYAKVYTCYAEGSSVANQACNRNSLYSGTSSEQTASRTASTAIGAGMANTNEIYAAHTTRGLKATDVYAAGYAWAYTKNDKSDWHLPSKDELNELCKYARQQTTGNTSTLCDSTGSLRAGITGVLYLSSSESALTSVWSQWFNSNPGVQFANCKNCTMSFRAVRAFG